MEIVRQLLEKKYGNYFVERKKNNSLDVYSFFQFLSLVRAYFKVLKKKKIISDEEINDISILWQNYNWDSLKKIIDIVPREELGKEDFNHIVKGEHSLNNIYFNELVKLINKYEKLIYEFRKDFPEEIRKEIKEESYPDIKAKWSIGIIKK